ncbi:hypothetical protein [Lichenicoccus sp.]|uniref:hypothetical protein n=1 Tax=Lichenicoccus sp. TaxID=2781899 RepID=UPI003D13EE38
MNPGAGPDASAAADAPSARLADLSADLQDASDAAVLRITLMVDGLAARGEADRVLDAVRPRLAALRPKRRRTLARTLFEPFDPVIVTPAAWRAGVGSIPRSFIAPVTALVRSRLPNIAAVEAVLAAGGMPDQGLWADTAGLLDPHGLPAHWDSTAFRAETGIRPGMLEPLCAATRLLFSQVAILRLASLGQELDRETMRPLLLAAARSGAVGWSLVVALLLEQSTRPAEMVDSLLLFARETIVARPLEAALRSVVPIVVGRLDKPAAAPPLDGDQALDAQARLAARIASFSSLRGELAGTARQLAPRRTEMAIRCCAELASGFEQVRTWAAAAPADPVAEHEMADRLESRLRALRRLDVASRPLGAPEDHERMLGEAVAFCADGSQETWLTRVDRLRLCEILVGAHAAERLF